MDDFGNQIDYCDWALADQAQWSIFGGMKDAYGFPTEALDFYA